MIKHFSTMNHISDNHNPIGIRTTSFSSDQKLIAFGEESLSKIHIYEVLTGKKIGKLIFNYLVCLNLVNSSNLVKI